ncbi:prepilin-type N-terminal cleavage/methylation domain-containing protein [Alkaliphilus sp. B6464]|nr:prepilin-type N-terminal cleavage/methylation domain-containing protein [Alkaliphilus sp. B6464]
MIIHTNAKKQENGYILIELIVSISLISIILISISMLFYFTFNTYKTHTEFLEAKNDAQIVLKYIEKRLMECNQKSIIYYGEEKIFQGRDYNNKIAWIDLSGKVSRKQNTLINFYKDKNEIRVNKNNENNVLSNNIKNVIVNELVEGKLVEIEVITSKSKYSSKIKFKLEYTKI